MEKGGEAMSRAISLNLAMGACDRPVALLRSRAEEPLRKAATRQKRRVAFTSAKLRVEAKGRDPFEDPRDPLEDPDMQRRINENKRWRRDMSPNEAWDIDKELDAVMYKRAALEDMFKMPSAEEKIDGGGADPAARPLRCRACRSPITDEKDISEYIEEKKMRHEHARTTPQGNLAVFRIFSHAAGVVANPSTAEPCPWLFPPRSASVCTCAACGTDVGYLVSDNPLAEVSEFFAIRSDAMADYGEE